MTRPLTRAASAPDLPAAGVGEKLNWDAFSARYFPRRRRHDLEAVAVYGAYRQGRDWRDSGLRTPPPRLTLVANESVPAAIEAGSHRPALERLLLAVGAEQAWEGEGGFTS
jgi:hypothetical protein